MNYLLNKKLSLLCEGHVDVVKLLMENHAKLDICDKDDKSILFHAAEENQVSCYLSLIHLHTKSIEIWDYSQTIIQYELLGL